MVEFQGIGCNIIQGIYWIGDSVSDGILRKHTIRDTIQTLFNQRAHYKAIGSPLQEAFKFIMNSAYGKTIMKDIKTTDEYIPNETVPEYFDKKYNLIQGIYSVNDQQSMVKLKKGTVHQFRNC